ncbi:MAG: GIY-YIG nuclease family protein [Candidatus Omnitrophica bacterium]|nr:GIY-YIG nuclease family protein [Candidatus Omnitrophota bacterium]
MPYVYALLSECDHKIYVGMSMNVEQRLKQHNMGQVRSTSNRKPFKVIYVKHFDNNNNARRHEKYLKSGFGRKFIKQKLKQDLFM